ncbi:MAG: secretin N-terminal domain-containing protein [Phycisphaerales bacterium]
MHRQPRARAVVAWSLAAAAGLAGSVYAQGEAPAKPAPTDSPAPATTSAPSEGRIRFNFIEAPFAEVLNFFARQTGLPVIREADPPQGGMTFISAADYSLEEALEILNLNLRMHNLRLEREDKYLYLRTLEDAARSPTPVVGQGDLDQVDQSEFLTVYIPLNNAIASQVAERITPLVKAPGMVQAFDTQNMLIVVETAGQCRRIREIVSQIDAVRPSDLDFRVFPLRHAEPNKLADALRALVPERGQAIEMDKNGQPHVVDDVTKPPLKIQPDDRLRAVIVVGPSQRMEAVEELVALLDTGEGVGGDRQLMAFTLTGADPNAAARQLQELFKDENADRQPRIQALPELGKLIVLAHADVLVQARRALEEIDPGLGSPDAGDAVRAARVIGLSHMDARQADQIARRVLTPRQVAVLRFAPAPSGEGMVVAGPAADVAALESLLHELDAAPERDREARLVRLSGGDAKQMVAMADSLEKLTGDSERDPVRAILDEGSRTVTLVGSGAGVARYEKLLRSIETQANSDLETRTYRLAHARPSELSGRLSRMARLVLDTGDGVYRAPEFEAFDELDSLVVRARPEQHETIAGLVKQLDTEALGSDVELRTYRVRRADPGALMRAIGDLASRGALVPSGRPGVTTSYEPSSRTLLVWGPGEAFEKIESLIKELDGDNGVPPTRLQLYTLEHARADRLAPLLSRLLETRLREQLADEGVATRGQQLLQVESDHTTNTLIISAPESIHEIAKQLIDALDTEAASVGQAVIKVIPLTYAEAGQVAQTVNQALPGIELPSGGMVRVVAAAGSNALLLTGAEADLKKVEELVEPLDRQAFDPEKPSIETFALEHADATSIAPTVQRLLVDQQQTDPRVLALRLRYNRGQWPEEPKIRVESEHRTNSLIVSGPTSTIELARSVIERLDQPDEEAGRTVQIFTPAKGDPARLAQSVARIVRETMPQGRRPLELTPEPATGSVVVIGEEAQVEEAVRLLGEQDDLTVAMPLAEVRSFDLEHADVNAVARIVQQVLGDRSRWPEELERARRAGAPIPNPGLYPDAGTSRVYVSAASALMPLAAELIEALDKPAPSAAVEVRVFRLKEGDAESVARSLTDAMALGLRPGEPRPSIRAEASSNSVVVAASHERLETAAGLIESMDAVAVEPGGVGVRTIFLEHARADTIAPIVERVLTKETIFSVAPDWGRWQLALNMTNRGQTPDFAGVKVAAEPRLNALIISAPLPMLELAEQMISGLDVDTKTGPGGERSVRVITLMNADARELATNVEALFADAETTTPAPTVRVDSSSNSLIVRGTGEQLELIDSLAAHLDKATLATRSQVRMITLDRSRVDAAEMARTLKKLLEERGGVKVEVITADQLLSEPDEGETGKSDEGPSSSATPRGFQPVLGGVVRSLVTLLGTQPVAGGGAGEAEPTVTIAVDPVTNTLMVVGSPRLTERIASLAAELERQMPTEPTGVRIVELPDSSDAGRVAQVVQQTVWQVGQANARNPGGFTGRVSVAADPDGRALIVWANETDFTSVRELIAGLSRLDKADELEVKVFPLANVTGRSALAAVRDLVSPTPQGRQARRVRTLELSVADEQGNIVRKVIDPQRVSVTMDPNETSLIVTAPTGSMPLIDRFVSLIDQTPDRDRLAIRQYTLNNADANELWRTLQTLFDAQRQGPSAREQTRARFVADDRTNSLFVTASAEQHEEVAQLIQAADVSLADPDLELAIIPLQLARPSAVQQIIQQVVVGKDPAKAEKVLISAQDTTGVFVVRAPKEDLAQIREIVEQVDTAETAAYPVRSIKLERADAQNVARSLQDFFRERMRLSAGRGSRQGGGAAIIGDRRSGTLVIAAADEDYEQLAELARQFDAPAEAKELQYKVIQLKNARASDIRQTVQNISYELQWERSSYFRGGQDTHEDRMLVEVNDRTNTVLLLGQGETMALMERIVAELDASTGDAGERVVRAVRAQGADLGALQRIIEGATSNPNWRWWMGTDPDAVSVEVDRTRNLLLLIGAKARVEEAVEQIRQIAEATGALDQIETVQLDNARATEVARELSGALPEGVQVQVTPVTRTNSIMLTGTPEALEVAKKQIALLDVETPRPPVEFRQFRLEHAAAYDVAVSIRALVRNRPRAEGEPAPVLDPSVNDDVLSVTATADELKFIESVIEQLDQPLQGKRTTEFIKLEFAQAEQVRKALGVFYGPYAQEANTPAERNVTIVADPASNSLVVSAGEEIWEGLRSLLAKLDTPEYDTTQQLVVIQLKHVSAVSVARALNEGFRAPLQNQLDQERVRLEAQQRRNDSRQDTVRPPSVLIDAEGVPTVSAERETNSLVIFAGRQELERIREIVKQMDVPDILKLPEARLIALSSGRASTLAEAVRRVFLAEDDPENPRRVMIYGDDASNVIIVRAEDEEFEQIEALADRLQAQAATAEALPRVIALKNTPAARMRDTIMQTFQPIARQRGEAFTVQIDRGTNSLVVAASETLHEQIAKIVEQLDGAAAPDEGDGADARTGGIGQNVTIIDLENNAPSDIIRHLTALGVTQAQPDDRPGLVSEPVRLVALTTRRGISVLANPADARTIERLVKELDKAPGLADEHVKIMRLKTAQADRLAALLQQMLTPSADAEHSGAAEGLVEQIRRLNLVNGGMDEPAVRLDLSRPIRVIADTQSNSVIVSSSIGNTMAVAELIKTFDSIPVGEAVTLRVFPLENASAARIRAIVEDLFRRGDELQRIPGTQNRGMPPTTVGRALVGPIVVTADERTNALVVAGPEEAVALVEVLLKDLDDGNMERGWIETSVIPLEYADAVSLAQKLRAVLVQGMGDTPDAVGLRTQVGRLRVALSGGDGAVTGDRFARMDSLVIEAEENLNALIVLGTDGNIAVIRELVKLMDVEQASASNTVRVIPLEHAAAERVAGIISDVFSQRQSARTQRPEDRVIVSVDARTNALVVSTSPRSFAILQGLLRTLDTEEARFAVGLHVIPVTGSDVERLAPKIQRLMRERIDASRNRGGRESPLDVFQVEAEPASNSLIVACSDENLELVKELVATLTTGDVEVADAERTALISIKTPGLAPDIARTITELYVAKENEKRGQRSVGVVANERMNALIASGTEEDIAAIRGLVAQLDQAPVELLQDVRRVRLDSAGAREIVDLIESVLAGRPIGGGRGGPSATRIRVFKEQLESAAAEATLDGTLREHVTLTPDPRTNSVLIKAPPELMDLIVTMIHDLDAETRGDRVIEQFRLVNADAGQMQLLLVQLFNLRQNGDRYVLAPTGPEQPDEFESGTFTPIADERQELSITIDRRTNTLLVSGTREYLDEVRKVVTQLDSIEATERERLVYHLRNTKATDIAETLQSYFSGERELRRSTLGPQLTGSLARELEQEVTVVGDERSNKLVISASPRYIETVAQIVEELDSAPPQVMIQVLLAEVTLDDSKEFGIDVSIGGVLQEGEGVADLTNRSKIGGDGYVLQKLAAGAGVATALGVPNFSVASADFGLLIRALQEQGKLEVLSRPQVQVNDNERAFIQVGENIGITDGVERRDTGGTTAIVRREDVGIILEVVPSISADGFVRMEITPEISTLSDRTTEIGDDFAAPIITQRRVETTVTVKDGQTVVIGGLMQSTDQLRKTKVPLLGDIPLLGALFRSQKQSSVKTELLVILTPYVIPGDSVMAGDRQNKLTEHALDMLEDPSKIRDVLENEHKIPMDESDETGFGDVMRLLPAPHGAQSWKERLKNNGSIGNDDSPR